MFTNTFNSTHHHYHRSLRRRHLINYLPNAANSSFLRPITSTTVASAATSVSYSASAGATSSATAGATSTSAATSLDLLQQHLSSQNFREADEETRRLIIALAGDAAVKRGYVFFSEVKFILSDDLRAIDALWRQHSGERFGYSVQRRIWKKSNKDFTTFFIKVGWMKKLESSEVDQYNYRSFPSEFTWEMEAAPQGHLPLTNALRGTQLLTCILSHPAFDGDDEDGGDDEEGESVEGVKPLSKRISAFKTNYTF